MITELNVFIFTSFIGFITILSQSRNMFYYLFLPSFFIFIVVMRISGYDADMRNYMYDMANWPLTFHKEFFFWEGLKIPHYFLKDYLYSFFVIDFLWIILLLGALYNYKNKIAIQESIFVALVMSFLMFLGYENIYRQFFATILFILAYSIRDKKEMLSNIIFLMAFFSHNGIVFLSPLLINKRFFNFSPQKSKKISYLFMIMLSFAFIFYTLEGFTKAYKHVAYTGYEMGVFYALIFVLILPKKFGITSIEKSIFGLFISSRKFIILYSQI
jgi:hypothetical protein